MPDKITHDLFQQLVQLAALELSSEEAEYLRSQLNNQLKAIHELETIPLGEDIPTTSHGIIYTEFNSPELRPDEWIPDPSSLEILEGAPEIDDRYILVPDIPHTDLE